jgi:CsoR family transcriptional regulator, copper-sensing transcriptional repressor
VDNRPCPLPEARKAELLHRLRRAEGQVRGLQKLLQEGADCAKIAQQLLATRHALDSTYVRLNLSVAEQEIAREQPAAEAAVVSQVLDRLQARLGRARDGHESLL